MHVNLITLSDLDRTHRIGQKKALSNKPRAVIIKFVCCNTRQRIFLNKKLFKGTQVSITESLTAKRMGILKEARENTNFATCGPQIIKYCAKMEMKIKLNFTMINLIFNVFVNVSRKWKKKIVTFAFNKFSSIYFGWVSCFNFCKITFFIIA